MTTNESLALRANQAAAEISVYNNTSFSCSHVDLYYGAFQALKDVNLRSWSKHNTVISGMHLKTSVMPWNRVRMRCCQVRFSSC